MALPFDLPSLSRGFAELSPSARALGSETAAAVARSLSGLLGREVTVRGRAMPGVPAPRLHAERRTVELAALPANALVEVDASLVARLVDLLAGGAGRIDGATALTPVEAAALELFLAVALDGAGTVAAVERAHAPRLALAAEGIDSPLAVDVEVTAGEVSGRARLLLPAAAVRALRGAEGPNDGALALRLPASLRSGSAPLAPGELDALSPGDVVLVDPPEGGLEALVLPGGLRASGRRSDADGLFHVEEMTMTDRNARLPITLEVELARVEISLADLARLEPGAALPLGLDRRGLVTLRAGERPVARGELVEVDGAIGVRILSLETGS